MKLTAITRVRNEEHIIKDTLEHVSKFADEIYVYDDCSTDNTVKACKEFPKVKIIIRGMIWEPEPKKRRLLEGTQRQKVYEASLKGNPDWIYYFDADEFADLNGIDFNKADAYRLRLFDYYITKEDKNKSWKERRWIGKEYRDILMLFKPHKDIIFTSRVPKLPKHYRIINDPTPRVKHYGKAISIEQWEETCDYYIKNRHPEGDKSIKKWSERKGKAVHTKSDYGTELILWEEAKQKGIKLND